MEAEGVTRTIHENLKPLLEDIKSKKSNILGAFVKHCASKRNLQLKSASVSTSPVHSSDHSGFFDAVFHAYFSHLHLILSPDQVWLAILQGVSFHVSNNADSLRNKLVDFQGQKELIVTVNPWNDTKEDWERGFRMFQESILKNIKPEMSEIVDSNFTTSTDLTRTATNIALMDCFNKFFKYIMRLGCGLPRVTLEGTLQDWQTLCQKAQQLIEHVDMKFWSPYLLPVLDEFIYFYTTGVNVKFWDCIYKPMPALGSGLYWDDNVHQYHAGWIVNFFPYTLKGDQVSMTSGSRNDIDKPSGMQEPSKAMKTLEELYQIHDKYLGKMNKDSSNELLEEYFTVLGYGIKNTHFPSGISKAGLIIEDLIKGERYEAEAYSGFFGCTIDEEKLTVKPALGWYVAKVTGEAPAPKLL